MVAYSKLNQSSASTPNNRVKYLAVPVIITCQLDAFTRESNRMLQNLACLKFTQSERIRRSYSNKFVSVFHFIIIWDASCWLHKPKYILCQQLKLRAFNFLTQSQQPLHDRSQAHLNHIQSQGFIQASPKNNALSKQRGRACRDPGKHENRSLRK